MQMADTIRLEQIEFEKKFVYAAMNYPDVVMAECGHLDKTQFADEQFGEYWEKLKTGNIRTIEGAIGAAIEQNVFGRIDAGGDSMLATVAYREWAEQIVKLNYLKRVLLKNADIVNAVGNRDIERVRSILDGIVMDQDSGLKRKQGYTPDEVHDEFEKLIRGPAKAVKTYLPQLDAAIGGFFPDELLIVASRPGVGKTAFTMCAARMIAYGKKRVLYISIEMSRPQLWARMACGDAEIPWVDVRAGNATPEQIELIVRTSKQIAKNLDGKLIIDDESWTMSAIHQSVIYNKPDIVFIDQLPDILWRDPNAKPVEWYGMACHEIRQNIARRLHIPVVLIHQINRGTEDRRDKRPDLSDLRGSGEIEQRCDGALGLYRDDYYEGRDAGVVDVPMEVLPLKMRQGDVSNVVMLNYNLRKQWFT